MWVCKSGSSNNIISQYNVYLLSVNYFFNEFQDNYKRSNSYQTPGVDNFNYNRIELLHIFYIPVNKCGTNAN